MKLISAASALLLAYLIWGSRAWPLIHDAPLMHYIAWLIAQGGVPYRDAFDMNLPGAYLLHLALLRVGGAGDLAWRLFDLGWLAATCALLWAYCRPVSDRWSAGSAAALFALYHLSGGAWRAGQRDFLLCLLVLAGAYAVARGAEAGTCGPLALGGLVLGAAIMVKPHAALFWVLCAGLASGGRGPTRSIARAAGIVLGTGLVVPALVFGWLASRGGLTAFLDIFAGYVVPLYGHVGRTSVVDAVRGHPFGRPLWSLLLLLGILALLAAPTSPVRKGLAAAGALYGILHFVVQGKGWEYQLYPLALFLCALAPSAVSRLREGGWPRALDLWGGRRPVGLAVWALLVIVLGAKGVDAREPAWINDKAARVAALTRDLAPLVPVGATVQVLDTTSGGIHALLRLGLRPPTRFIYDFHFFHDGDDPRIRALRAELLAGLASGHPGHPAAVVVLEESWPDRGYERLAALPELERMLATSFTLAVTGPGYRIYAKRSDS